jgi:hypothetical protein
VDSSDLAQAFRLALLVAAGAITYASVILLTMRTRLMQLWRGLRSGGGS